MRKDLMLVAALTGLTFTAAQADPGGNSGSALPNTRAPIHGSRIEESGEVSDRNAAPASITSEVTNSGDRGTSAAQDFRRETPGTLGARGTIGQDGTGFTGQERTGTLPPGRLGFYKTNDFDKTFERAHESIKEREAAGQSAPFDPTAAGGPGSSQIGHANELNPASTLPTPKTDGTLGVPSKTIGAAVTPSDSGPAGVAGQAGRYNGQPVTPGLQTSAVIGHEGNSVNAPSPAASKTKPPTAAQGSAASSEKGTSADRGKTVPDLKPSASASPAPNNSSADPVMSNRIRQQLVNGALPGTHQKFGPEQLKNVDVKAANGEVTLSGTVSTRSQKRDIESMVKQMRGVSSVNNQLTIKGADAQTDNLPGTSK